MRSNMKIHLTDATIVIITVDCSNSGITTNMQLVSSGLEVFNMWAPRAESMYILDNLSREPDIDGQCDRLLARSIPHFDIQDRSVEGMDRMCTQERLRLETRFERWCHSLNYHYWVSAGLYA